jgi:adenylyltransferase/sulfurtransferase
MQTGTLGQDELLRYNRNILIPEFGLKGQLRLKNSKALVVGAGGLGSPVLLYLAAAGIGTLGIVDGDVVDNSNLQRQILYNTSDVGQGKASTAARKLKLLNPLITVQTHQVMLKAENALEILSRYDIIIDGSDNFPTRYLVNDACLILGKPLVYGSIFQFEGQVSVFNLLKADGSRSPNYRDLFPEPPPPGMVPSCAEGGVLGVLPGIIGSMQASEAIKVLAGIGSTLTGRLYIYDAFNFSSVTLKITKNPSVSPVTELIDYEEFCGIIPLPELSEEQELSAIVLAEMLKIKMPDVQLIDVRQPHEYQNGDIGGEKMPLDQLDEMISQIKRTGKVVVYCQSGIRSKQAILQLTRQHGFDNLHNLTGGIDAYLQQVLE